MLLTSNRSLAEESLARRPRLCNGKLQLADKYQELSNLATTCWEKQSRLGELTGGGGFLVSYRMPVDDRCQDVSQEELVDVMTR